MARSRLAIVYALLLVLVGGNVVDDIMGREHWPFSNYPMFSGVVKDDLSTYRMTCLTRDAHGNCREMLLQPRWVPSLPPYKFETILQHYAAGRHADPQKLDRMLADYLATYDACQKAGVSHGPDITALRLYRMEIPLRFPLPRVGLNEDFARFAHLTAQVDRREAASALGARVAVAAETPHAKNRRENAPPLQQHERMVMQTIAARWNRFWFAPADAQTLGFTRLVVMLGAFLFYRPMDFLSWGFVRYSFWFPIPLFKHLHWHPMVPMKMWVAGFVWKALLLLGGIGLFGRFCCAAAFVLGLYLLGLPNNLGKVDHSDALILWAMLVLAVVRSCDAWSIELALIRTGRSNPKPGQMVGLPQSRTTRLGPEYRWPLRLMQVLMVSIFFISGTSKLRNAGLAAWAFSDNLRNTFLMEHYLAKPKVSWGIWIAAHPYLCMGLAFMSLCMETGSPLALFSRIARWIIIPILFLMQVGNELLLGINFRQFMLCYAFWIPWLELARFVRAAVVRGGLLPRQQVVLFDGSCGICTRTMAILRRLDLLQRIEILDVMNDWPAVSARYPALNQDDCLRLMHVINQTGAVTTGFYAYRTLCYSIPMGWLMLPMLYVPGVPTAGKRVYQHVADNRFRTGCGIECPEQSPTTTVV